MTCATSNVFNVAPGAVGMVMTFLYWEPCVNQGLPRVTALGVPADIETELSAAYLGGAA